MDGRFCPGPDHDGGWRSVDGGGGGGGGVGGGTATYQRRRNFGRDGPDGPTADGGYIDPCGGLGTTCATRVGARGSDGIDGNGNGTLGRYGSPDRADDGGGDGDSGPAPARALVGVVFATSPGWLGPDNRGGFDDSDGRLVVSCMFFVFFFLLYFI